MTKRSKNVTLPVFAVLTTAALAGCGDEPPPPAVPYASVEQCISSGNDAALCKLAFDKAEEEHVAKAPRFNGAAECEKAVDVTRCVPTQVRQPDGSFTTMFLPAMAGYMLGRATAPQNDERRGYSGGYLPYGGGGYSSGPIYGSRDYPNRYNDVRTIPSSRTSPSASPGSPSSGTSVFSPSSKQPAITLPSRPANVGTTTVRTQGFGGGGGSFSSSSSS